MRVAVATLAVLVSLAACDASDNDRYDEPYKWKDITGKGRSDDIALADKETCYRNIPPYNAHESVEETNAAFSKAELCMRQHGWEIVEK